MKLAILASGSGTNAQAMIDKMLEGILDLEICLIFSNRPKAKVLERAQNFDIPHIALDHTKYTNRTSFDMDMLSAIHDSGAQAIALAGYMLMLSPAFLAHFKGPVLNLHPAILPSFPGLHGAADALAYGVKITGATVHFVDEKMDHGPVVIQAAVPIKQLEQTDTLLARIHALEHRIYPQALQWLAQDRLTIQDRTVVLKGEGKRCPIDGDYFIWPPLEEGF